MKAKVIKTQEEYEAVLARVEELMDATPNTAEAEELELLAALAELYEDEHFPVDPPDPVEAIRFRMQQAGLKQKDLVQYIGSPGRVSEVLSRKRALSLRMIRALHRGLGIPAEAILGGPSAATSRRVL